MKQFEIGGKTYPIVCLDFETFYAPKYSLTSTSMSDYVYDRRFKIHGASIDCVWHTDMAVLKTIDWKHTALLCHNALFDGFILHEKFGIHPAFYLDTLPMARAALGHHLRLGLDVLSKLLGGKGKLEGELVKTKGITQLDPDQLAALGVYANNDVGETLFVFEKLYPFLPDDELKLIDMTLRMFCDPVLRVNRARAKRELDRQVVSKAWKVAQTSVTPKELRSRPVFRKLLESLGAPVPYKMSKTTGLLTLAFANTDEGFKQLLRHPDAAVRELCEARQAVASSIGETRAKRFLDVSKRSRSLPVALNYSGAHTHRWSGANKMNMQNLERGGELRRCIRAPVGYSVVVADSSQIEARFTAWLADEKKLLQGFKEGRDLYSEFASEIYKRTIIAKVDKAERFVGKTCLAKGTLVLCQQGWMPIEDVQVDDLVWDGEEWVCHQGVMCNGWKETQRLCGISLTPDHLVWSGTQWVEAQSVAHDADTLSRALAVAVENLPAEKMSRTSVEWKISKKRLEVFDILSSGPKNRFVVLSDKGPLIVHNCILGLGFGMGPDRLHDTLMLGTNGPEVDIPRRECQNIIDLYRTKYWGIPQLWKTMDHIAACMLSGTAGTFKCISYGKEFIKLPGGLFLRYSELRYGGDGKLSYTSRTGRTKMWGGILTENIVQALARRSVAENMLTIGAKYRVVLMTHDEVVFLAKKEDAEKAYQFALKVMGRTPVWAPGLPLAAEGGHAHEYSK